MNQPRPGVRGGRYAAQPARPVWTSGARYRDRKANLGNGTVGIKMRWNNLGEHTVYENKWLTVRLADVELPDGSHLDHFLIRQRPVALCAAVNDDDEVLLLWRHRFIPDTWGWELPSGVVDAGETIEQAAAREFLEETGWRAGPLEHLITVEPSSGLSDVQHHVFRADGAVYVSEPTDDFESDKREWIPLASVPDLVSAGEVRSANTVAALLLLHQRESA